MRACRQAQQEENHLGSLRGDGTTEGRGGDGGGGKGGGGGSEWFRSEVGGEWEGGRARGEEAGTGKEQCFAYRQVGGKDVS